MTACHHDGRARQQLKASEIGHWSRYTTEINHVDPDIAQSVTERFRQPRPGKTTIAPQGNGGSARRTQTHVGTTQNREAQSTANMQDRTLRQCPIDDATDVVGLEDRTVKVLELELRVKRLIATGLALAHGASPERGATRP